MKSFRSKDKEALAGADWSEVNTSAPSEALFSTVDD